MSTRSQLQQLLQEDQEPFHLQDYIADRRRRLFPRRPNKPTHLTTRPNSNLTANLCKSACFFTAADSPNVAKSPALPHDAVLLHVPARTAEMLLEAAARIWKRKKSDGRGLGMFGSILRKLKHSGKRDKSEVGVLVKDILRLDSSTAFIQRSVALRENPTFSPDIPEPCCCLRDQNLDFVTEFHDSPFQFVLRNSPSGHRTSDFSSQVDSPSGAETATECGNVEEEEKEYCSPVSVLDPDPYQEEDSIDERHQEDDDSSCSFDMDCSCANVQRAQQKLLEKLSRFEKLAELDPLELEVRLQEDEEDSSGDFNFAEEEVCKKMQSSSNEGALSYLDKLSRQVLNRLEFETLNRVPAELRRVIKMLLSEEERKLDVFDEDKIMLERVVLRLDSWKEVAGGTVNVMVGLDIGQDIVGWTRRQEQVADIATDAERALFEDLMDELCQEFATA
uniref:DUF4378 domain-containing protein n=1 Tax=Kalanchoe fedtschenkoi TaxID=63787 RepID=A0A7N0UUG3_KALFE